ncbi:hypothetical protein [Bradyrhizobium sp. STM 3557]|uniref:hypothetical protein n=1 Tax=Bradyrhizobium sp. STM 3557 TaxID=578920 RepID=UPI003890479B
MIAIIHQVQQLRLDGAVNDPASGEAEADMGSPSLVAFGHDQFNASGMARRHGAGLSDHQVGAAPASRSCGMQ